jgi:hypothetical protein
VRIAASLTIGSVVVGCATQADLNDQAHKLQSMIAQQSRSIEGLRQDLERLRTDIEGGRKKPVSAARPPVARKTDKDRLNALDKRLHTPPPGSGSGQIGETLSPEGTSTEEPPAGDQGAVAPRPPDSAPAPADAPAGESGPPGR